MSAPLDVPPSATRAAPESDTAIEAVLAEHAAGLRFEQVPDAAVRAAGVLLLDTAACMVASLRSAQCVRLRESSRTVGGAAQASLVGSSARVPAPGAAFVNGTFAHWYEWDDVHTSSVLHASAVIFPALLACAESMGRTDGGLAAREFTTALVAAFDVGARVSEALVPYVHNGWMPTGFGVIGAAAGAARLLGLDADGIRSAMGIAAAGGGISRQAIDDRVSSKNASCGLVAQAAVHAALLARDGLVGPPRFLDGAFGMNTLFAGSRGDAANAGADLSNRFAITGSAIKPYPCCRSAHGAIDMALELVRREPGIGKRVQGVEITMPRRNFELVGAPFEPGSEPRVSAQFSVPFTVALALLEERVDIDAFDPDSVRRAARVRRLAAHVHAQPGPGPGQRMQVRLIDGSTKDLEVLHLPGSTQRPLSDAERAQKVQAACAPFLAPDDLRRLEESAGSVHLDGIAPVLELLRRAGPTA